MNTKKIQNLLNALHLDAWLIYQNQGTYEIGLNTLANDVCGIKDLVTRPWFCQIKRSGPPTWIYQSMEQDKFVHFLGKKLVYGSRDDLVRVLKQALPQSGRIAMEISSDANIPALSRVDYGTITLLKKLTRATIVSSQNLVGTYLSIWGKSGYQSHLKARNKLIKILNLTTAYLKHNLGKVTDLQLQKHIEELYVKQSLITLYHPVVASGKNTGNPHYFPSASKPVPIQKNELLLIDIWGKTKDHNSIFADVTTMFYTGRHVPDQIQSSWKTLKLARDTALNSIIKSLKAGHIPTGSNIDDAARAVVSKAGLKNYFVHRTGHNISTELHGFGPNLDNYETKDTRQLVLDSGYSIEPGIYTPYYGLRSEINIYISPDKKVIVTTPQPTEIQKII
ncbi:hypothetical protein A3D85_01185 [Candidatus Amesbacteria bacterium RIFCSPHIGHO2_02_FULL_47_9]|uniref:Peptidase M24 domain-containing protein n=1 Tax=Candidatus Amesbacteria bacterium RIFCSPHIGHO2_01_FULL_48_32b TaxID=1797253 RepID=A0A1F4YFW6_9BACT|nr:MAG: hypothetical protein A2876_01960 [Candidatus Amesbacteria bacterium RIFCSPHIGHO2_01_FULL_48_32b]OGD02420.1 MAG: hypothetical protein A3D85_01185 [Candidatus Amesbacteria bacterium RIFCSPHIGHO2_02_FULL_47_9]OGD08541.1 MAG: hypothetical protein A2899_03615 [Candidatus Amesbacteria bacterium RIFCSPLOWO2_01_FULL_49_25]